MCAQWVPITVTRTHDFLQGLILGVLFSIPLILGQLEHGHSLWAGVRPTSICLTAPAVLPWPCSCAYVLACCAAGPHSGGAPLHIPHSWPLLSVSFILGQLLHGQSLWAELSPVLPLMHVGMPLWPRSLKSC